MDSYQGTRIASENELNVIQAALTLKIPFEYQYEVFGGRYIRGGQVIDFLFQVDPQYIPANVQGEYWHFGKNRAEDLIKQMALEEYARNEGWAPPLFIPEKDTETVDLARAYLKQHIGV